MPKKITLIYPFAYGYFDFVIRELQKNLDVEVTDVQTNLIKYQYPNFGAKIGNGIRKLFGKNIKKEYFRREILNRVKEKQDLIFIIRPDLLEDSLLQELKNRCEKFTAYYYDSCRKYPRQLEIAHFFDEIFSYDSEDIRNYHFKETTNFIYDEEIEKAEIKYDLFNISSYDSRIDELVKVSDIFSKAGLRIHFILFWFKKLVFPHLISVTSYISLEETKKLISQSRAMVDIQRKDQTGLSFRTFESLGYRKKLLTTNNAVKDYDFFHPNNMMILDPENIDIEKVKDFLDLPYFEIPDQILEKYRVRNFVKNIFKP